MVGNFHTVLVANRGEIAVRVMRSARALGYRTAAVFSEADADAPHVRAADVSVGIGPAPAAESYLSIEKVISAAKRVDAGAIHPGYGFLAENAEFAAACDEAGIVFIGPPPEAITAMGDKAEAKRRMEAAGVPLLGGYQGTDQSDETLVAEAGKLGVPLMVKAAAGGGGKGMRLLTEADGIEDAIAGARREALAAFGSDDLILERAVMRPRHVEIQVLADSHGNTIALGERDCSVQRRHQKVVEECPSPAVDAELRARMGEAGVAAAAAVGYVGAGTVEFLLDEAGEFSFLEMNTRLQVEHPVTELVTGLDLVEWQLRVARGEELTISQDEVTMNGHAIEVRLYAEDPANDFLPATGRIEAWDAPAGPGIRVDAGIETGGEVTIHYDPMIAKLIAHGDSRSDALLRLADALDRTTLLGPVSNRTFLASVLRSETFRAGEATTAMLAEEEIAGAAASSADIAAVAVWDFERRRREAEQRSPHLSGFSSGPTPVSFAEYAIGEDEHLIRIENAGEGLKVSVDGGEHAVSVAEDDIVVDDLRAGLIALRRGDRILAHLPHTDLDIDDRTYRTGAGLEAAGEGVITAPMHGSVISVEVAEGDTVAKGDKLVVLEAMKMEQTLVADVDGTVTEVVASEGQVEADSVLVRIEPEG